MPRKQARSIARELALLSLSQVKGSQDKIEKQELTKLVLASIRTLTGEVEDALEAAAAEVQRGSDRLSKSETLSTDAVSAKAMVRDALQLTQTAIERLGAAIEIPEFIYQSNRHQVREYALELIGAVYRRNEEIDQYLKNSLVNWQLERLPRIDRDIMRIAVAEICFLNIEPKIAIDEAVKLAQSYSEEDGYRFINGVLGRVTHKLKASSNSIADNPV